MRRAAPVSTAEEAHRPASGPPWRATSKHGFPLDEVVSALQKSIRRGLSDDAAFWAVELNESGFGAWAWRRLTVIASEDVGLADPMAAVVVHALFANADLLRRHRPSGDARWDGLTLLQAVAFLSRAPKNREAADCYSTIELRMARGELLVVPDWALDGHTARGRSMKRTEAFFQLEGRLIAGHAEIDGDPWAKRWQEERPKESQK
jgi:replication-associated recombination protein RarA